MKSTIIMALVTGSLAVTAYASIDPNLSLYEYEAIGADIDPEAVNERQSCDSAMPALEYGRLQLGWASIDPTPRRVG